MMTPSALCFPNVAQLYRYRPGQDPDAGAEADVSALISFDVPCSVQPLGVDTEVTAKRLRQTTAYQVLFAADYGLAVKDLIVWADPRGATHKLFVTGRLDQAGRGVMWVVLAVEVL